MLTSCVRSFARAVAKSFDNMFELQEQIFLFLFARQSSLWQRYPAVPPPLNLLSLPFYATNALIKVPNLVASLLRPSSTPSRIDSSDAHSPTFTFPTAWAEEQTVDRIAAIAAQFVQEHSPEVLREDRFKHELFTQLGRHFAHADSQASKNVVLTQEKLRTLLQQGEAAERRKMPLTAVTGMITRLRSKQTRSHTADQPSGQPVAAQTSGSKAIRFRQRPTSAITAAVSKATNSADDVSASADHSADDVSASEDHGLDEARRSSGDR
jgi:hypothetical protein